MPTVTKQKPFGNTKPAPGSILGQAIAVEQMPEAPLKLLIYGQNRVGKTTLACQWLKPLLLISWEPSLSGGMESVRKVKGVSCVHVVPRSSPLLQAKDRPAWLLTTDDALQLCQELRVNRPFASVVFDGATSCQDVQLTDILDLPAAPDQMSWGMVTGDQYRQRSERTREVIRPFLDLPMDTVILAKERDHNPPKEERVSASGKVQPDMRAKFLRGVGSGSFIAADLGGATVGWLQDACDGILRLSVEEEIEERRVRLDAKGPEVVTEHPTGRFIRHLRCCYHPNYAAGIRSCRPEAVPEVIAAPTYQKLIAVLRGK